MLLKKNIAILIFFNYIWHFVKTEKTEIEIANNKSIS
jgi:hypothetical protein